MSTNRKKDREQIMREFKMRQSRQIIAIAAALFLVLLSAVIHKRPDLFGAVPRNALFGAQIACIAAFLGFSAFNWRCPACGKFLGRDIHKQSCSRCGATLS